MHNTFGIDSPDYEEDLSSSPRVLFVTMMPSFLSGLAQQFKLSGFRTKLFLFQGISTRSVVDLTRECDKADIIFCEFMQTPTEIVTSIVTNKAIYGRLWRCELYNPKGLDQIYWEKLKALFIPTESVEEKYKLLRKGKLSSKLVRFMAPAVDMEKFQFHEREFDTQNINISILGNVIPRKGQLSAARILLDLPSNFRLTIGGEFKDQEYVTHLRDFISKNKLSDRIRLLGKIYPEAVPEFFNDSHIVLGMSNEETGHFAIAEGMATGCFPAMLYWRGSDMIYPEKRIHRSYLPLINSLLNWGKCSPEERMQSSKESHAYVQKHLNSAFEDKKIVDYVKSTWNYNAN